MRSEIERKKRKSVFTPLFRDVSSEAFWKLRRVFIATYPESGELKETIFCLFFNLLIDGVLPASSPVNCFYSLELNHINIKSGEIRIPKENYPAGVLSYLSSLSQCYLFSYLRLRGAENAIISDEAKKKLIPPELIPKKVFFKDFRRWLITLAAKANLDIEFSISELARMRELSLLNIYPSFIVASICKKINYSSFSEYPACRQKRIRVQSAHSGISSLPVKEVSTCLNYERLFEKHDRLNAFSNRLNQFTLRAERQLMMKTLVDDLSRYPTAQDTDEINFVILASWFHHMLSSDIGANTIKAYFMQNSLLLRTELLGQSLEGFSQDDAESILENCSYGKAVVLKSALRSFLSFARKNHGIKMPEIAWRKLVKQKNLSDSPMLCPADIKILLASGSDEQKIPIVLGAYCGLRVGEVAGLSLRDISIRGESFLYVRRAKTKSGRRWLPLKLLLPPEIHSFFLWYYFKRLEAVCFDDSKPLLVNSNGQPFTNPQILSNSIQKLFNELEYDWATFHTLRHSFASMLLLRWYRTVDPTYKFMIGNKAIQLDDFNIEDDCALLSYGLPDIARLMGHADIKTTVRNYVHTISLVQKAYLDRYEIDHPICVPNSKVMIITGLSKPGFYKQFSTREGSKAREKSGVPVREIAAYLRMKVK